MSIRYKLVNNGEIENIAMFKDNADGQALAAQLGYVLASDDDEIVSDSPVVTDAEHLDGIREVRDELLAKSDWTQNTDSPLTTTKKAEWGVYRQSLRDLTSQDTEWYNFVWPTEPT